MGKILFWLAVLALIWIGWRVLAAPRGKKNDHAAEAGKPQPKEPVRMAQCAYCGVHFPSQDALPGPDGRTYCSAAHRDAAGQR